MNKVFAVTFTGALAVVLLSKGQEKHEAGKSAVTQSGFSVVDATIPQMRTALEQGRVTSRELVTQYLGRIALYNWRLNAVMTVNPKALEEAGARDRERAEGRVLGPLHGIPIALKDNIMTTDMPTTGGALVFDGFIPPYEATLAKNLRDAGAIIIAKTTLSELASWVNGPPVPGGGGNYNAILGPGMNPYDPRRDPRDGLNDGRPAMNTGGSSSGAGTAVSFWAANVGSDTTGSVLSPSNQTMLVGIRPTLGRISRYGVIPIVADQDTAGPMARTVTDAAILLGALESAQPDPGDPATRTCTAPPGRDYTRFLNADALKGARIGIPRAFYYDEVMPPGAKAPRGGINATQAKVMSDAIEVLTQQGAVIVDPVVIPSVVSKDPTKNYALFNICASGNQSKGKDADCSVVLKYGMKRDFNKWLASLGPAAPVKSLTELRFWNITHLKAGAIRYGQARLDISDELDVDADRARYEEDRAKDLFLSREGGLDAAIKANKLDALLFPGTSGSDIASRAGYPQMVVPFGMIPNNPTPPFPPGFDAKPAPYGVSFTGPACSEPRIIALGYAFEQASKRRIAPPLFP